MRPIGRRAHREFEHRPIEPDLADRELRRMHADREPARAGIEVVAAERALAADIELAIGVERERMRRDDGAAAQRRQHLRGPVSPVRSHAMIDRSGGQS